MDNTGQWLERELTRQLSPVAAPDSLWNRIQFTRPVPRAVATGWVLWPVLTILMMFASGDLIWQMTRSRGTLRQMTQFPGRHLRIVAGATPTCDFWSNDPAEIRNWVKTKQNIEIEAPPAVDRGDSLVGVKLVSAHGRVVAAVAYRGGRGESALLVSNSAATCLTCHDEASQQM
jgi:hypothetical protein